jgi:hypothetical protein
MNVQYWQGFAAGKWAAIRKRLNWQYVKGWIAGMLAQ